jgi:hypothetical protein
MLQEEAFHLGSGRTLLKEIGQSAARGEGDYSVEDMQRAMNQWLPRGLEMFGNEGGGETAVTFGFKDKTNATAQAEYIEEVRGVVTNVNVAMIQERLPGVSREDARAILVEVEKSGDPERGIKPEDVIFVPDAKFFRKRGIEEHVFRPYDVRGRLLTEGGRPYSPEQYIGYLSTVLPAKYVGSREYNKYVHQMNEYYSTH